MEYPQRYSEDEKTIIDNFFERLAANTRKSGKISESKMEKLLSDWQKYDKKSVIEGIKVYNCMRIEKSSGGKGKNESYVTGIIRNKQEEITRNGGDKKHNKKNNTDEGERLSKLAEQLISKEYTGDKCNF